MTKVKLLTSRATARGSNSYGDVIEVTDKEAKALIAKGSAKATEADKTYNSAESENRIADLEAELKAEKEKNKKENKETDAQRAARLKKEKQK